MISRDIKRRIRGLPNFPESAARIGALLGKENATAARVERELRSDPAMTANLLHLANSPAFGLSRRVGSIQQAVVLLGFDRLFEILTSAALQRVLPEEIPGYRLDTAAFWQHCVAVAVFAEGTARELNLSAPNLVFTAGLLHDVGKLVVGELLGEDADELHRAIYTDGLALSEAEEQVLGTTHTEVGALVATEWNLPKVLLVPIRFHHRPDDCPDEGMQRLVDLVHVADGLAHTFGLGGDTAGTQRRISASAIERLGLERRHLEHIASQSIGDVLDMAERL